MSELSETTAAALLVLRRLVEVSDSDLSMWDACSEDGIPTAAEERHAAFKSALSLIEGQTLTKEPGR